MCARKLADIKVLQDKIVLTDRVDKKRCCDRTFYTLDKRDQFKTLKELGRRLYCGEVMFNNRETSTAKTVYENCKRKHGTVRHSNDKRYRERFANEFARRMSI